MESSLPLRRPKEAPAGDPEQSWTERYVARIAARGRRSTLARLLLSYGLLEVALWAPLPIGILFGIAALWYISRQVADVAANASSLGLDLRGIVRQSWLVAATLGIAVAILAAAYFSGSLHRLWGMRHPWYAAAAYTAWAFVQQFMLQCFCLPMLRALVSRASALLLAGALFAIAHLPNPSLTLVAFFAGVGFTAIYARKRNLYVVALIHAVLGLTLAVSTPDDWFHQLRVGRDFLHGPPTVATTDFAPRPAPPLLQR
jgi:membrane protease YdiL (CAAX protease family)